MRGIDTTFLVEAEIVESAHHQAAREIVAEHVSGRHEFALAPQVLAEFVHVVTDPRRFDRPLGVEDAVARAAHWWNAREVRQIVPTLEATALFLEWMTKHRLGRKRIPDTQLAATYRAGGIVEIVSTNARDFSVFGCFRVVAP